MRSVIHRPIRRRPTNSLRNNQTLRGESLLTQILRVCEGVISCPRLSVPTVACPLKILRPALTVSGLDALTHLLPISLRHRRSHGRRHVVESLQTPSNTHDLMPTILCPNFRAAIAHPDFAFDDPAGALSLRAQ